MKKLVQWAKFIGECLFALSLPGAYESWIRRREGLGTFKLKGANKVSFELLIHEIQECKSIEEINPLLDSWIKANDLHPEKVKTLTAEECRELMN